MIKLIHYFVIPGFLSPFIAHCSQSRGTWKY